MTPTASTAQAPQRALVLDRYEPIRRLGSGGFGTVWLARDLKLSRLVALKRIPVADATVAERARRESLAAARLSHPAIVALYESAADEDAYYLVSEHVRGATLGDLQRDGALSDLDVLEIGIALCDAMAHAHKRGVIHRDIKPQNILIPDTAAADGSTTAKLTDFGIARLAGDDALTMTGDVVGTLAYMAPEQADGQEATAASDLYSLALCLYEAFSGVNPVRARGAGATARRVGRKLPALGRLRRDLPHELCEALDAAVSPIPAERGSVRELRVALAAAVPHARDDPGTVAGPSLDVLDPLAPVPTVGAAPLPARFVAAGGAGGLVYGALALLGPDPPADPFWLALGAAVLVALLPRVGWLVAASAICVWLTVSDSVGLTVLVLAGLLPVPLTLMSRPSLWSAPGGAPLLGLGTVGALFPVLAGQLRAWPQRFALGALGAWWILLAESLLGEHLLTARDLRVSDNWQGSAAAGFNDVLIPLVSSPPMLMCAVWGAGALMLPWLVRGRNVYADIVLATTWTATIAAFTATLCGATAPGLVLGAALAGVSAVALAALRADQL